MKPKKNRVFCNDCGKPKMLFETEKKADNFILFNQEEIEMESGFSPQRSYFCVFCGGWHITSIKEKFGMSKNEKLLEDYLKEKIDKSLTTKIKINNEEKRNNITLEIENQIKAMDKDQKEVFFSDKIELLSQEIENLNNTTDSIDKERLKELRINLEIIYIVRKKNKTPQQNKMYEKLKEKQNEEWRLWIEKTHNKKKD